MFRLEMQTDNAAFEADPADEIERIMKEVAKRLREGSDGGLVCDVNGKTVGRFDLIT